MQKKNENNKRRHSKLDLESRRYAHNEMLNQVQHDDTYFHNNSGFSRPSSFPSPRRTGGVGNVGAALYPRTLRAARHSGMTNAAHGFTLVELLVVVLIIGILAGVALPQYNKAVEKSRASEAKIILNKICQLREMFLMQEGGIDTEDLSDYFSEFMGEYLQNEIPGEYEEDNSNCFHGASPCFKTKNWMYDTDASTYFYANRNINGEYPYELDIDCESNSITCGNWSTSKDYCKMLCGSTSCQVQ